MSSTPKDFDEGVNAVIQSNLYKSEHGPIGDKWIKSVYPNRVWYVHGEKAMSRRTLPQGGEVETTLIIREDRIIFDLLKRLLSGLENNLVYQAFLHLAHGSETALHTIPPNEVLSNKQIQGIKKTVEACSKNYNEKKIIEFRNWLQTFPELKHPTIPDVLFIEPNYLTRFSQHLAEERTKYYADVYLFGSVATITDICGFLSSIKHSEKNDHFESLLLFNKLAWYITTGDVLHPVRILSGTINEAIKSGFVESLIKIMENYKERVANTVEAALNSESIDNHLERLYEAIPYAFGAFMICARLLDNTELLNANTIRRVRGSYNQLEEIHVRLREPFSNQVFDFNGDGWKLHKKTIEEIRRKKGLKASEEAAIFYVEEVLFYPRSLIPDLLK